MIALCLFILVLCALFGPQRTWELIKLTTRVAFALVVVVIGIAVVVNN